jgi:hypothetical protein
MGEALPRRAPGRGDPADVNLDGLVVLWRGADGAAEPDRLVPGFERTGAIGAALAVPRGI